jgi:hypothetical protein
VLETLEMPDATARPGVERQHAVGEQIVAVPRDAVKIEGCRPGGGEHHAERRVDGDTRPHSRRRQQVRPSPGVATELPGFDGGRSSAPAGVDVERADATRGTGSVSGTELPMISRSSKTTPGVLALTLSRSAGWSSPSRRSMRPPAPKDAIGWPVFLSNAQRKLR